MKFAIYLTGTICVLTTLAAICFALLGIWTGDNRWGETTGVSLMTAIISGGAAAMINTYKGA